MGDDAGGVRGSQAIFVVLLACTAACTDAPGRVHVTFALPASKSDFHREISVVLIVEDHSDPVVHEPTRSPVVTIPTGQIQQTDVGAMDVPNGEHWVAKGEIHEGGGGTGQVLCYAISAEFEIAPGEDREVMLTIGPRSPPIENSIRILTERPGYTNSPLVQVELTTDTGVSATLSNDGSFMSGTGTIAFVDGRATRSWMLEPCSNDRCDRTVFAKMIDDQGYPSAAVTATVVLDTRPPELVPDSVELAFRAIEPSLCVQASCQLSAVSSRVALTVSFALNEPTEVPIVEAVGARDVLPLVLTSSAGTAFSYTLQYTAGSTGTYAIRAQAIDLAGYEASLELAMIEVDTTPPFPPTLDAIVYERRPWGDEQAPRTPHFALRSEVGAIEPGANVLVVSGPDVVASVVAMSSGSFQRIELDMDYPDLRVVAVDRAGNESMIEDVAKVEWTALITRDVSNPNRAEGWPVMLPNRDVESNAAQSIDGMALEKMDTLSAAAMADALWIDRTTVDFPSKRYNQIMVSDRARGRVIMFGGQSESGPLGDTWSWDGFTWRLVDGSATPRYAHAAAYDPVNERIVGFGGEDAPDSFLGDTIAFDGLSWRTVQTATSPAKRAHHTMAFDPQSGGVLLFGGLIASDTTSRETWLLRGNEWTNRSADAGAIGARYGHVMALDPECGVVVLCCGRADTSTTTMILGDTWTWSGSSWSELIIPSPGARYRASLAWDPESKHLLLYGGRDQRGGERDDVVAFDCDRLEWTPVLEHGPPLRSQAMAEDIVGGHALGFGGLGEGSIHGDLLIHENGSLRAIEIDPAPRSPAPRRGAAMAYDGEALLMYGGQTDANEWLDDVWRLDGPFWSLGQSGPPALASPMLVYDETRDRTVLIGATSTTSSASMQVWEWDRSTWTSTASGADLPLRLLAAAAYDPSIGEVVVFGGIGSDVLDDDWSWNGARWLNRARSAFDMHRYAHAMASTSSAAYLFGGGTDVTPSSDFWIATPTAWMTAPSGPAELYDHSLVFDPRRQGLLLFGGWGNGAPFTELWFFDPSAAWTRLEVVGAGNHSGVSTAAASDPSVPRVVTFGGCDDTTCTTDKTLELNTGDRPAVHAIFDWAGSKLPPGTATEIDVDARATASGGAELWIWDLCHGEWSSVGTFDPNNELHFKGTSSTACFVSAIGVHVAIVPRTAHDKVSVDFVGLTVKTDQRQML